MIVDCFPIVHPLSGSFSLIIVNGMIKIKGTSLLPVIVLQQSQNSRKRPHNLAIVMSFRGFSFFCLSNGGTTLQQQSEEKGTRCPCCNYLTPLQHRVLYQSLSSTSHILTLSQRKLDLPAVDMNSIQPSFEKRTGMPL